MRIIHTLSLTPKPLQGSALALGNFDGLHRGHQTILEETLKQAAAHSCPAAVMTFEPHPRAFFTPDAEPLRLMRLREKIDHLRAMGFSALFLLRFNRTLASTSAEDFVRLLVESLQVRHVVTGDDFCFGAGRAGNSQFFAEKAAQHGFSYHAIAPICEGEQAISSTRIRSCLQEGNLQEAACLLGRPYTICGHVVHGDKRGRELGFPTANIPMSKLFLPRRGVYKVSVQGAGMRGQGVANIGIRPTFAGKKPQAEIHLLDYVGDLYGRYIEVQPLAFLRDEQAFASVAALKQQIAQDAAQARNHEAY